MKSKFVRLTGEYDDLFTMKVGEGKQIANRYGVFELRRIR